MHKIRCIKLLPSFFLALWLMVSLSSCSDQDENKKTVSNSEAPVTLPVATSETAPMEEGRAATGDSAKGGTGTACHLVLG